MQGELITEVNNLHIKLQKLVQKINALLPHNKLIFEQQDEKKSNLSLTETISRINVQLGKNG